MFYYALVLLVVGSIAVALHLAGVSSIAIQVVWLLFLIGGGVVATHFLWMRSAAPET